MQISKAIKRYFTSRDIFGHHVKFNFNRNGHSHNTVFGGICSVILMLFLAVYVGLLIFKMLLFEEDRTSVHQTYPYVSDTSGYPITNHSVPLN